MARHGVFWEAAYHYVRTHRVDDAYHVGDQRRLVPLTKRFIGVLGEAEVDGASKELLCAIELACFQKFVCSYQSERCPLLTTDDVLSAVSARNRHISGTDVASTCKPRK